MGRQDETLLICCSGEAGAALVWRWTCEDRRTTVTASSTDLVACRRDSHVSFPRLKLPP